MGRGAWAVAGRLLVRELAPLESELHDALASGLSAGGDLYSSQQQVRTLERDISETKRALRTALDDLELTEGKNLTLAEQIQELVRRYEAINAARASLQAELDDVLQEDGLKDQLRQKVRQSNKYISVAAKLLAPVVEQDTVAGFNFVVDMLRANSQQSLATELEIAKALHFMRSKEFDKAIETLKSYERKDQTLVAHAAHGCERAAARDDCCGHGHGGGAQPALGALSRPPRQGAYAPQPQGRRPGSARAAGAVRVARPRVQPTEHAPARKAPRLAGPQP